MRRLVTIILLLAVVQNSEGADAVKCSSTDDSDVRNYCMAMTKQDSAYCEHIHSIDKRNLCMAQTKHEKSYCYHIKSPALRDQCVSSSTDK